MAVAGRAGPVCYGSGSFMALDPPRDVTLHPVPLRTRKSREPFRLMEKDLEKNEEEILRHADAALAEVALHGGAFIQSFWGFKPLRTGSGAECTLKNGLHIGNRVGHAQGGILLGMAAATAAAALPALSVRSVRWSLSGISAWYIGPGDGPALRASSKVVHLGRLTAVVRTRITGRSGGKSGRRVLEVVTTHNARA